MPAAAGIKAGSITASDVGSAVLLLAATHAKSLLAAAVITGGGWPSSGFVRVNVRVKDLEL